MKDLRTIGLVCFLFCLTTAAYSQGSASFHFGPTFPVSDFASDDFDDDDAGGAAVGLNIGLQYVYPLAENGLGIFGGIDFNYNGLKKDYKDDYEEFFEAIGVYDADYKFPKYINVPISAGLNYTYQADEKVGVFANAGLALNFLKITEMEVEVNNESVTQEVKLSSSLGFKIGAGILLNQKTSISIDYYGLGEHDLEGEMNATGGFSDDFEFEQTIDFVTLTLGFRF